MGKEFACLPIFRSRLAYSSLCICEFVHIRVTLGVSGPAGTFPSGSCLVLFLSTVLASTTRRHSKIQNLLLETVKIACTVSRVSREAYTCEDAPHKYSTGLVIGI